MTELTEVLGTEKKNHRIAHRATQITNSSSDEEQSIDSISRLQIEKHVSLLARTCGPAWRAPPRLRPAPRPARRCAACLARRRTACLALLAAVRLPISRAAVGCRTKEREARGHAGAEEPPDLRVERRRGREIGCAMAKPPERFASASA